MSEIKLSGMNILTKTFGPFSLVRPCKVLLTLLPGFLEAICCSFCHVCEPGKSRNFSTAASAGKTLSQFRRPT